MPFMQQDPRRLVWQQNDRYLWIEPGREQPARTQRPSSAGNEK